MQKWEYSTIRWQIKALSTELTIAAIGGVVSTEKMSDMDFKPNEYIARHGREGWEMFTIVKNTAIGSSDTYWFKRLIQG